MGEKILSSKWRFLEGLGTQIWSAWKPIILLVKKNCWSMISCLMEICFGFFMVSTFFSVGFFLACTSIFFWWWGLVMLPIKNGYCLKVQFKYSAQFYVWYMDSWEFYRIFIWFRYWWCTWGLTMYFCSSVRLWYLWLALILKCFRLWNLSKHLLVDSPYQSFWNWVWIDS